MLAVDARMEKSDKFRGEPMKGGGVGARNANYSYEKRAAPLDFEEGFGKLTSSPVTIETDRSQQVQNRLRTGSEHDRLRDF
jgi:hypothetical protein